MKNVVAISFLILLMGFTFYYFNNYIQSQLISTFTEEITNSIITVTTSQLSHGNSSYNLGQFDVAGFSLIKYLLASINVALFRPYFWEYANPLVVLTSIEGLLMTFMFLYILIKKKFTGIIKLISNNMILSFSLSFTLILAAIIGGIAFNFGTLSRYKEPITPFFFSAFIIFYSDNMYNIIRNKIN